MILKNSPGASAPLSHPDAPLPHRPVLTAENPTAQPGSAPSAGSRPAREPAGEAGSNRPTPNSGGCAMCGVLNKHKTGILAGAVYIGRGSKWGNPFRIATFVP